MSIFAPNDNSSVLVPDLGSDCVHQVRINGDNLSLDKICKIEHPGCGPRHLSIHPTNLFAYVINEMGSHISAFRFNSG